MRDELLKPGRPVEDILLKSPEDWTEGEEEWQMVRKRRMAYAIIKHREGMLLGKSPYEVACQVTGWSMDTVKKRYEEERKLRAGE